MSSLGTRGLSGVVVLVWLPALPTGARGQTLVAEQTGEPAPSTEDGGEDSSESMDDSGDDAGKEFDESGEDASAEGSTDEEDDSTGFRPPPRHRWWYTNTIIARVNPLGLIDDFQMGYRYRLFDSDSILFRDTWIGLAFKPRISPSWIAPGVAFELQPIAVFNFRAAYWLVSSFGIFNHMQAFAGVNSEHDDDLLDDIEFEEDLYADSTQVVNLQGTLQAKVGPVAIRNIFQFEFLKTKGSPPVTYSTIWDTLVPGEGFVMNNDTDVLWVSDFGLVAGLRYTVFHALYDDDSYAPGANTDDNPNTPIQRLGILAAYTFFDEPGTRFNKPTILTLIQWHIEHRYRAGQEVSAAIPYFVLGFRFEGELLGPDDEVQQW